MKEIVVHILNSEYKVVVFFGPAEKAIKIAKKWRHDVAAIVLHDVYRRGICFFTDGAHPFIWMPNTPKTPQEFGTLAHEAVHAVNDIFDKLDEPIRASHEVFAHSVGAIVREVLTEVNKPKNKNDKRRRKKTTANRG